jgi:hypothetical protein
MTARAISGLYKSFVLATPTTLSLPSFSRSIVVLSFSSLYFSCFLPGAQPGAFFLNQTYTGRQTLQETLIPQQMAQESWFQREFLTPRRLVFNIIFYGLHFFFFGYGWYTQVRGCLS